MGLRFITLASFSEFTKKKKKKRNRKILKNGKKVKKINRSAPAPNCCVSDVNVAMVSHEPITNKINGMTSSRAGSDIINSCT